MVCMHTAPSAVSVLSNSKYNPQTMPREYHFKWEWDLDSSPEALWPLVSDTNRFNRDTGQPRMETLGIQDGVKHVKWHVPLVPLYWDEEPFDWIYPSHFGILRRFRNGPFKEIRISVDLIRRENGGTHLVYEVWDKSANLLGDISIPLAIGLVAARRIDKIFRLYDRLAARGGSAVEIMGRRSLSSNERTRLTSARERLLAETLDSSVPSFERRATPRPPRAGEGKPADRADMSAFDRLAEFLDRADDLSVQRMRPYALADGWNLPRRAVLETFLRATRLGVLDMYWELLCPECRGVAEGHGHLRDVNADSHCNTCNIDFRANFDHNIEVIFRPNPAVRPVKVNLEFCVGSPQRQPHVIFSQSISALKTLPIDAHLEAGRYSLRASGIAGSGAVNADSAGNNAPVFRLTDFGWPYGEENIATNARLNLVNATETARTFSLERTAWSDQAATGADVTNLQIFRDLFASEVLRPGEEISVGNVTLMFTDLRESTRLYRQIGDAPAFGRVREHFVTLERAVAAHGGAVIKTMGDSIMASFQHPAAALRALREAQMQIAADIKQPLWLKAGIHRGPCIVVNLNERLDYFGSTVNIAARLPGLSAGGEVIFSGAVHADLEAGAYIKENFAPSALTRFTSAVKGYDEPFELWRLKIQF